jgi:alcohol dehydrogenase
MLHWLSDGTFAEYCLAPKNTVTPIADNIDLDDVHLSMLPRFAIVYGGLLKGRLAAGETIIITGATGQFGMCAVFVALAMGAGKVIAAGRNEKSLQSLVDLADDRLTTVKLAGDVEVDTAALRKAADGGAHVAFDMVGMAKDSNAQSSALKSLLRGGRMVLMGSVLAPWNIPYFDMVLHE